MALTSLPDVPGLSKRSPVFLAAYAQFLDAHPELNADYLSAIIAQESGFNPAIVNPQSGASGLLQWMPSTAPLFHTTVQAIRGETDVEQLSLVGQYFARYPHALAPRDLYLAVFYPSKIGHPDDEVIATDDPSTKAYKVWEENKGLDLNGDGELTVGEVRDSITRRVNAAALKPRIPVPPGGSAGGAGVPSGSHLWVEGMVFAALLAAIVIHAKNV